MELRELSELMEEQIPATGLEGIGILIAVAAIALAVVLVLIFTRKKK